MKAIFAIAAVDDMESAAAWLDERRPGLGDDFLADARDCVARLAARPEAYAEVRFPRVRRSLRDSQFERFPYLAYFELTSRGACVIAVIHGSRDARSVLRERLKSE